MKPYSQDIRDRVIHALVDGQETQPQIAARFAVSLSFVEKLWRRWRTTGSSEAKPHSGGQSRLLKDHSLTLEQEISLQPDATLAELSQSVAQAQAPLVSQATICRELQRLNLRLKKKSPYPAEQDTERVKNLREEFRQEVSQLDVKRLKWVDETGMILAMTRAYGRAAPGERVKEGVPKNYGKNHTLIAAMGLSGIIAPFVVEGALDGQMFREWVREAVCPSLEEGDILIWDNLSAHKVEGVKEMIEERGAKVLWMSPYSPDYNPIEECWSKIKTYLRKVKARTKEALMEAIKQALETVTQSDIRGWFTHCGYPVH